MVLETHCNIVHGRWLFRDTTNLSVRGSDCCEVMDCELSSGHERERKGTEICRYDSVRYDDTG